MTYYCTRLKLAERLLSAGLRGRPCKNPFPALKNPYKGEIFAFDVCPVLIRIVKDFYDEIGQHIPLSTARVFHVYTMVYGKGENE